MYLLSNIQLKFWLKSLDITTLLSLFLCHYHLKALLIICSLSELQVFIIMSCLISVSVNFSTFLVIGKTSPVTYQVLGHLKTCLVLAFGYTLLHDPFDLRNILGILVALMGMVLYSYFCTREGQKKAAEEATQLLKVLIT